MIPLQDDVPKLASVVRVTKHILPGNPSVEVSQIHGIDDLQCQWSLRELLGNLFTTIDEGALQEHFKGKSQQVNDMHFALWPGYGVPEVLHSKHVHAQKLQDHHQAVFLKKKTMSTSLAISWISWAFSDRKRMPAQRDKSWACFANMFTHCLESAGRLSFQVKCIGEPGAPERGVTINSQNSTFDSRALWKPSVRHYIEMEWNRMRLELGNQMMTSNLERPSFLDLVFFGLHPKNNCKVNFVKPLALSLLAQFAFWLDANIEKASLEVQKYETSRQKNRVSKNDALNHSIGAALQFYLHENDFCHVGIKFSYHFDFCFGYYCDPILEHYPSWKCPPFLRRSME